MADEWDQFKPVKAAKDDWEQFAAVPARRAALPTAGEPGLEDQFKQGFKNLRDVGAGAIRGAGSIGATLLAPFDAINDYTNGRGFGLESNRRRRADMDAGLRSLMGADTESGYYGAGKLGTEVLGTLGVGPALAAPLRVGAEALPALSGADKLRQLASAVETAGFRTGATPATFAGRVADMGMRIAGGGVTGGTAAWAVDPESAGIGVGIGAALPPVLSGAGALGRGAARLVQGGRTAAARGLAQSLGVEDQNALGALVTQLRGAQELVPGSRPTVAQVTQNPTASALEDLIHDTTMNNALRGARQSQGQARMAALEGVAPIGSGGFSEARNDFGEALAREAVAGDAAARAKTRGLYQSVPQDEAALYLPDLVGVRDKYFGAGSFTNRDAADRAVRAAEQVGTVELPAVGATRAGTQLTLAQAVRKAGGISAKENDGLRGEVLGLREDVKSLVRKDGGLSPSRMAEKMREAGYIADEDADTLFNALREDAARKPVLSSLDDLSKRFRAAQEASDGVPGAERAPVKVTLREFDNLRKSIGEEQRKAAREGNATLSSALKEMKSTLDDRINEVVRGDGLVDENLPLAWADALDAARRAKIAQVQQYRTGPQAAIFRTGSDGEPILKGGEVAAKFWGARPGLADDVKDFRRLIADNPETLGRFKSLVTTEGAATAKASGELTSKFSKWVADRLPGLKEAFEPQEVETLQRIAQDIKRAEAAAAAGGPRGSKTYQNATNAIRLGLLDSPLATLASAKLPAGGLGLNWLRDATRGSKANRLADLLADPNEAANALEMLTRSRSATDLARIPYRVLPVVGARQ